MKTTLNKIREHSPCADGWTKLLTTLGKTKADDEPLSIFTVLDSNGLEDALWCLRAVENEDKKIRLFAVWCARQVQHLMTDERSIKALDVAEAFANGSATQKELAAARVAAGAAGAAGDVAWAAAGAAAGASARAARDDAGDDARAARDDAGDDAWAAAGAAAWASARAAAWAAAWAAARAAARATAWDAAWDAARASVMAAQEKELRRICGEQEK